MGGGAAAGSNGKREQVELLVKGMAVTRSMFLRLLTLILSLIGPLLPPAAPVTAALPWPETPALAVAAAPMNPYTRLPEEIGSLYFEPTAHHLSGGFLRFWWEHGQTKVFGLPISAEATEGGRVVQYFERARLEYFPDRKGTAYEIQPSALGRRYSQGRTDPPFEGVEPIGESPERDYVEATRHTISYAFKRFWEANNGLLTFGYPLSEEFNEGGVTVQYFERARFEYNPAAPAPDEDVQVSYLGLLAALESEISLSGQAKGVSAVIWTPTLATEMAERRQREVQAAALAAVPTAVAPYQAVVVVGLTAVHQAPTVAARQISTVWGRHIVRVVAVANGEPIDGDPRWLQIANGGYVPAASLQPFAPPRPPRIWSGRWIDVNLSQLYATAYEGAIPVYSTIITAGRDDRTPVGVFTIQSRVRVQTMDSTTVGFPKGHREYYYLPNVEFVQYFTGRGHAIHSNYWVHPSRFGNFSSNGCLGMLWSDAAFFWQFAGLRTPLHIHY